MGPIYSLGDFLDMVRRRAALILFVILLGCIASVIFALMQKHMYASSEVIQIEQPKIANDLAPSTVEGSSARRLQLIEQQLMARSNLLKVIEKFGLYANLPDLRDSEKVDMLRFAVSITGVAAAREGFSDDGTISVLTITAEMESAELAQAVAREFADLTRNMSAARRQEQTRETLEFFEKQEENLNRDIAALEEEQEQFRSKNDLSIEGSVEFRRAEITSLNEAILTLDRDIIAAQLARTRIDPSARAATVQRLEEELDAQLNSLTTQRSQLDARRTSLATSIQSTPEIDRALANFERRMTQLQGQLDVISTRRNEAEVGFSLESASRGERLITLEEAQLPDYPYTASRKKRALMGGAASIFVALGVAFLMELRHPVLRTARQMERETGLMPVVAIPQAPKPKARKGLWQNRREAGQKGRAARIARSSRT
ncbi:MAG: Wzz/FepE/Etk N-terminal domain-containing protein [Sulfitobacter sp.]